MTGAKERLGQLMALAAQRQWTPLARALADLTLDWPADFPDAMRAPVSALLETALRECAWEARSDIAARFAGHREIPLRLLNALYLEASAPVRREILMRNELEGGELQETTDAGSVLALARRGARDFSAALSDATGVPYRIIRAVLADDSGEALAVLCRGLGLNRAIFSAIALLRAQRPMPLEVFDSVPDRAAAWLVNGWRKSVELPAPHRATAAE